MCTQIHHHSRPQLNLAHELRQGQKSPLGGGVGAALGATPWEPTGMDPATQGGTQLSFQAQRLMMVFGMMSAIMNGQFGQLMNMLGGMSQNGNSAGNGPAGAVSARGGFGQPTCGACSGANATESNAPKVAAGEVKELKAGEEVRGANGTILKWGKDGNVDIRYKDQNGQEKTINVKDGMLTMDGGRPQKLENVGQMLKLPNGDVVGIGNNPSDAGGKQLCRVVMADNNGDKVKCEPANATSVYDIKEMQRSRTSMEGGGISMNFSSASFATPYGMMNYTNVNVNQFLGHPVTRYFSEQQMSLAGTR